MGEVLTVASHKGGCAKTVTTLNLGYSLMALGYKVAPMQSIFLFATNHS